MQVVIGCKKVDTNHSDNDDYQEPWLEVCHVTLCLCTVMTVPFHCQTSRGRTCLWTKEAAWSPFKTATSKREAYILKSLPSLFVLC